MMDAGWAQSQCSNDNRDPVMNPGEHTEVIKRCGRRSACHFDRKPVAVHYRLQMLCQVLKFGPVRTVMRGKIRLHREHDEDANNERVDVRDDANNDELNEDAREDADDGDASVKVQEFRTR